MSLIAERLRRRFLPMLLLVCPLLAWGGDDADLLSAKMAFDRGDRARLEQLAPTLAGHPLEAYVDYWRLKLGIDTAADDAVRAFLQHYPGSVLADRLRSDWLKSLARRGQWGAFGTEIDNIANEDVELTCFWLQYRRQHEGDAALAAAKPLWFTGASSPDACLPLFEALIARNDITVADRRARFRLAVQSGNLRLAESVGADLPEHLAARELLQIERDPARALAKGHFRWSERSGQELALYALERAARTDAAGVRSAWEKQRGHLPASDRLYGNVRIAYYAARQLLPQANEWFRDAQGAALSDAEHVWRVRAALRVSAWSDVLASIEAMPPALSDDPAWRYWKARALAATGRDGDAAPLYASLAGEHHYYALLAAEALGRGADALPAKAASSVKVSAQAMQQFASRSDVRRAVKLAELDLRTESRQEWYYAVRDLDDDALLVAAEYARRMNLYDRAINTAERTSVRHDYALRYLMPFRDQFTAAAREQALDAALLFGLARQESRFNASIVSSAGAIGLMQLMPATARWVAKQLGKADYRPGDISDVAVNTQFGAFYFRYCLDKLERLPALAAAAYNAGPGRAQSWRASVPLEGAIWVETIPFNETRDYVKKVLANAMFYARELDQPYVALTARLGTIPPRGLSNTSALASVGR
ncbi:MAG TPA: transglycosylase SLT domain-containing protein [Casimicrobiaceae bacterium]|nr:transglycosylase SLT domain-containing protein [Casimicrobiaceae bacterium]